MSLNLEFFDSLFDILLKIFVLYERGFYEKDKGFIDTYNHIVDLRVRIKTAVKWGNGAEGKIFVS